MKKTILILVLLAGAGVAAYLIYRKVQADKNGMTLYELRNTENNNKRIENGEIAGPPQVILKGMQQQSKAVNKYFVKRG
ncbi:MAG: hypothetical protein IKN49_04570 [Elusimicrobiaceae bacterium]|nr:hypothetical protein [Candidatus Saccharibacteria bacterium]MBR3204236.1 hypothetical protein [Candidatus Saccharibacteria bacterium]MBR3632310.1 hypothetical protein [Elusimicrobiaceae bacterium]